MQYDTHFTKPTMAHGRQKKEKGVTNDRKSMLITENYKKVHNGDGYSVLWEKPHKSVYFKGYVSRHMCEKSPRIWYKSIWNLRVYVTWNFMLVYTPQNLTSTVLSIEWTDIVNLLKK